MKDRYPENITIEIDRDRLRRYLNSLGLSFICWLFVMFSGLIGLSRGTEGVRDIVEPTYWKIALHLGASIAFWIMLGLALALAIYFVLIRRSAARRADEIELSVVGPFLHIKDNLGMRLDRKIHFRAIVDYSVVNGWLMRRHGIDTLKLTTTSVNAISIPGVKNATEVRDMLAEIDAAREL
ncbi:hypothetical protein [Cerasicoccus fimbriatus]|uniref:hypothetical protein n=1 Tax=Cerasicoccus fimbriatus TaxID=3014554 RepID=UPI0022B40CEE|nr:hypothetical protein [Cerasicoccus sp. TK19100]